MAKLPPVLIVNGVYDPATAVSWSAVMRENVPTGINVYRDGGGHTSYRHMGNTTNAIDAFLIDGKKPVDGTIYTN